MNTLEKEPTRRESKSKEDVLTPANLNSMRVHAQYMIANCANCIIVAQAQQILELLGAIEPKES